MSTHSNGTPRSSNMTTTAATLTPSWRPPKAPLPPHRLAKLANALGVSTPVPATHTSSFLSRSYSESSSSTEQFRRSPTPSTVASTSVYGSYGPPTSKYLLHVIPPLHLPHDFNISSDSELLPPPNASGYHIQFRRGILVPVHASFQAQLGAIAKEYALPSTAGLVLYLVSSGRIPITRPSGPSDLDGDDLDDPGPRISEEIWKHIWTRVLRAEHQDENSLLPPRSPTPFMTGLATGMRSTPFLVEEAGQYLRPVKAVPISETFQPQPVYGPVSSPSTPSSTSDLRSNSKSAPPSSVSVSYSEPDTLDTSVEDVKHENDIDLPGLHSPSLIPILAKVEFDIDLRRAGWYEPWLRSRKANHAKRSRSRADTIDSKNAENEPGEDARTPLIELIIGRKQTESPFSLVSPSVDEKGGDPQEEEVEEEIEIEEVVAEEIEVYKELPDSDSENELEGSEDGDEEDATARVSSIDRAMHGSEQRKSTRMSNPNIVDLALTGADLTVLSSVQDLEDVHVGGKEEDEVQDLLDRMSRPSLATTSSPDRTKRSSSPASQSLRKHVPPPLILAPHRNPNDVLIPTEPTPVPPSSSGESTNLPYLYASSPEGISDREGDDEFNEYPRVRSPEESEKRGGAVFDDLDLGLDPTEDFDADDPHDRRRSQYLMKAQLDEIERTLAQFSPRILKADLEEEQNQSFHSRSTNTSSPLTLSPGRRLNSDVFPPSPRLPQHAENMDNSDVGQSPAWPAVPFSKIKDSPGPSSSKLDGPPSPPRLALNGVTTSAPKSFLSTRSTTSEISIETERRKRELEEERSLYPPLKLPNDSSAGSSQEALNDPSVIPLSPDPFGRYPSTPDVRNSAHPPSSQRDTITAGRSTPLSVTSIESSTKAQERSRSSTTTSRFSADSITGVDASVTKTSNRTTLMTIKGIKKLWRKSNSKSVSTPVSATSSGRVSLDTPSRPERPAQEQLDLPDIPAIPPTPTYGRFSPQPIPSAQSENSLHREHHQQISKSSQHHQLSVPPPGRLSTPNQEQLASLHPPQHKYPMHGRIPGSSQEQLVTPHTLPQRQFSIPLSGEQSHSSQEQLTVPHQRQLSVPPPGRMSNTSPIIAAQMLPGKSASSIDRLRFDQESPYPIRAMPARYSPRGPSPPPSQPRQRTPPIPEKDKNPARKSILKAWKSSSASVAPASNSNYEPRASVERPNANAGTRGRRPSVINFGSTRTSTTTPDLPPSPQIPEQFFVSGVVTRNSGPLDSRQSIRSARSRLTVSSTDSSYSPPQNQQVLASRSSSPPRSILSSRDSQETRPSFDASQFEIVSPKMGSTLSYPYHSLDHD